MRTFRVPYRLAIVASHVIQYQDPLFRMIAREPDIDLTVLYCSRHGLDAFRDADMATTLSWDIDLLGYPHRFLRNAARDISGGFWRLINPGIVPALLMAYERMRHRDRAAVVFMGDGVLRAPLESYAREHALGGAHFIGFLNQSALPRHYAMADVFVLPSTYEPRGAVINEAMACGLPVVVTDRCGSIGDIVLAGDNAFVYPAGDADALAELMERLVVDPALRARMAQRSREIISTWTFAR